MINLQILLRKLTRIGEIAAETAAASCAAQKRYEVEAVDLLFAFLSAADADVSRILERFEIHPSVLAGQLRVALERLPAGNTGTPSLSPRLIQILTSAWTLSSLEFGTVSIRSAAFILALLEAEDIFLPLREQCTELRKLKPAALRRDWQLVLNPKELACEPVDRYPGETQQSISSGALERFTVDLTQAAREARLDPVIGREREIRQVIDILTRRKQNNPILVGEAGVGKTAIVEAFALRIAAGDVPPGLLDARVLSLDPGLLQAGAGVRGEFEARLKSLVKEAADPRRNVILFIDEAHALLSGAGTSNPGDAANLLKPALARGELKIIAATTFAEYRRHVERDAALARRFQTVQVDEPDEDAAIRIVRGLVSTVEKHHRVRVLDEAVRAAVTLSHRYVTGRQLPDKAVSVLDTACSRVALSQTTTPPSIDDSRRKIFLLEQEIEALRREMASGADHNVRLEELFEELAVAETRLADLEDRWAEERRLVGGIIALRAELEQEPDSSRAALARAELESFTTELADTQRDLPLMHHAVDERVVADVIADWTGIPAPRMVRDEMNSVVNLHHLLAARVVGQDQALESIARRIRTARARLEDPGRPAGVFLLAGPSGVGKTETALSLADILYGGERNAVVINMSEFQEAHSVSGLKGSPPGYVGYGEGGVLTESVRRRPYCVLLLDEFEKAHPDVLELFYQVFDKGKMEDAVGREIDFRNTIIIATSNAGDQTIQRFCARSGAQPDLEELRRSISPELRAIFKPALLGRMIVVPYVPIGDTALRRIAEIKLDKIAQRIEETYRIRLGYSIALVETITRQCVETETGARDIDRILTESLLPEISRRLLAAGDSRVFTTIRADAGASGQIRLSTE